MDIDDKRDAVRLLLVGLVLRQCPCRYREICHYRHGRDDARRDFETAATPDRQEEEGEEVEASIDLAGHSKPVRVTLSARLAIVCILYAAIVSPLPRRLFRGVR